MLKLGKRKSAPDTLLEPVVLFSAGGTPLTVFAPEVIANYRRMVTGLIYRGNIPARMALASALRGEGVTYSSLALATTIASDLPATVCVVELNWWHPGLVSQLGEATRPPTKRQKHAPPPPAGEVPTSPGISAVLAEQASLDEALIYTHLPNLCLLPAGEMPPAQRSSVARSPMLKTLIDELSERFEHVIIDVPPLMFSSDGMALASLADAVAIVTRQGVTPVNFVKQALDEVKHLPVLGLILNEASISMPRWTYNLIPQE